MDRVRTPVCIAAASAVVCATGCVAPPAQDLTEGPGPTPQTIAIATWAHTIDDDSVRRPTPCAIPEAVADQALVSVQRPNDSSTKIVVDFRSTGGRATEQYYALRDTLRLFVRVDERYANATGLQPSYHEDTLWLANGAVERWVDSSGFSHALSRESVGYRAENVGGLFARWLRAVRDCR